ncbi:mRNA decay activator protein ZFP36L1-like [Diaphorina citri]|uniref:mRNA decay activator protein ZFP36L1-like n=1 Tax=Diaphorina citri TaxID=121845 RepID=A0A1S3DI21_DIACI|nr:mRNA decay activator protein ZFP36L1-like [Diaphorina citri]
MFNSPNWRHPARFRLDQKCQQEFHDRGPEDIHRPIYPYQESDRFLLDPIRYKTELCRSLEGYRPCQYGERCRFAHSVEELRPPVRHYRYRTRLCRNYHHNGVCNYGTRCSFIHRVPGEEVDPVKKYREIHGDIQETRDIPGAATRGDRSRIQSGSSCSSSWSSASNASYSPGWSTASSKTFEFPHRAFF